MARDDSEDKMTASEVKENFPVCLYMCRKAPWGSKSEGSYPIMCGHAPRASGAESVLSKTLCMHIWEGSRTAQMWGKKPGNWPKVNKDPEGLPYIMI